MHRISSTFAIKAPISEVFHFHDDTNNLLKITPPNMKVDFETFGPTGVGHEVKLNVKQFGILPMKWHVRFKEYDEPHRMVDEQVSGPFKLWRQIREFKEVEGGTELKDIVEYELPLGPLGRIANWLVARHQIRSMFEYRQTRTKELLESGRS